MKIENIFLNIIPQKQDDISQKLENRFLENICIFFFFFSFFTSRYRKRNLERAKGSEQSNVTETGTPCADLAHCPLNSGRVLCQQCVNQVLLPCLCSASWPLLPTACLSLPESQGEPAYLPHCPCEHCCSAESFASFH